MTCATTMAQCDERAMLSSSPAHTRPSRWKREKGGGAWPRTLPSTLCVSHPCPLCPNSSTLLSLRHAWTTLVDVILSEVALLSPFFALLQSSMQMVAVQKLTLAQVQDACTLPAATRPSARAAGNTHQPPAYLHTPPRTQASADTRTPRHVYHMRRQPTPPTASTCHNSTSHSFHPRAKPLARPTLDETAPTQCSQPAKPP